ncbi:arylsulfatase [Halopseudomonas aestusnigri]|jgi:arylsulfatase|uniref:arylsulfatase n=1 Tax=Halopseudomonas aestusnigri TaxID=857252 RepID=UPI000C4575D2|nr:arylsulfatase [Pseudomonadales bacterium]MBK59229.1 arylsulfatase [Pseudomonas sp.]MCK5532175.1 arylsulfatase [Halopseudomonas aestusnigri]HCP02385.1 arylsulfatase [Pseudomonas sp.]|tara:strand:- start:3806 stop:5602 length:1797 start_codon:yes stop_codon:yes gene_type:complete
MHRPLLRLLPALGLSILLPLNTAGADSRPNILLIVADDLGFSDLGAYGGEIHTPNIDQLAASGVQFTNFHVAATCSPTRSMLMTGVTNHLVGMGNMKEIMADNQKGQPGYETWLNDSVVTLPTLLQDAGYNTYMAGKWHLGDRPQSQPVARGFTRSFALMESGADNWEAKHYLPGGSATWIEDGKPVDLPEGFYSSFTYADKLIDYIDSGRTDGKPFFGYLAFQAVHAPHQVPEDYIQRYADIYDQGWDAIRQQRYQRQLASGLLPDTGENAVTDDWGTFYARRHIDWASLSDEEKAYRARQMAVFAGMAEAMDTSVGKVLSYLKDTGQYDNTLILFMSDNGGESTVLREVAPLFYRLRYDTDIDALGAPGSYSEYGPGWAYASNTPFYSYKGSPFSGGMRVPLIVSQPGRVAAGTRTNSFGYVTDITPTLLDIAGVTPPGERYRGRPVHPIMGESMRALLEGRQEQVHDASRTTVYELAGGIAVWRGNYKLVTSSTNAIPARIGPQLFDTANDPLERHNLAQQHPEIVSELYQAYRDYVERYRVIEVPPDYRAWEQVTRNGREQFIAKNRVALALAGLVLLLLVASIVKWQVKRRRR